MIHLFGLQKPGRQVGPFRVRNQQIIDGAAIFKTAPSPTGGLILSGSAGLSKTKIFSVSGGLVFTGTAVLLKIKVPSISGGLIFSGSAVLSKLKIFTSNGGLVFGGSSTQTKTKVFSATGGIIFSGSGGNAKSKAYTPTGGLIFAGTAFYSPFFPASYSYVGVGGFRLNGYSTLTYNKAGSQKYSAFNIGRTNLPF